MCESFPVPSRQTQRQGDWYFRTSLGHIESLFSMLGCLVFSSLPGMLLDVIFCIFIVLRFAEFFTSVD